MASELQLKERLKQIQNEYEKKQRKLKKFNRAAKAKEHVKKKLREQASLSSTENNTEFGDDEDAEDFKKSEGRSLLNNKSSKYVDGCQKYQEGTEKIDDVETVSNDQNEVSRKIENSVEKIKEHLMTVQGVCIKTKSEKMGKLSDSSCLNMQYLNTLETVSGSENSCSQDMFNSPKTLSRNVFEDIHKTVVNTDALPVVADKDIKSEMKWDEKSDDTCCSISAASRDINKTLNIENAVPVVSSDSKKNDSSESKNFCDQNSDSNPPNISRDLKDSAQAKWCQNKKGFPVYTKKSREDTHSIKEQRALDCNITAIDVVSTDTDLLQFDKVLDTTLVNKTNSPSSRLNNPRLTNENFPFLLKKQKVSDEIKDSCESVLAVSESSADSDRTVPSSSEDIINVKLKGRKRRSLSTRTYKCRQSLRIAELSSQDSLFESSSDTLQSEFYFSDSIQKTKHSDQTLVITSIFQCLMDNAKRESSGVEFSLPLNFTEHFHNNKFDAEKKVNAISPKTDCSKMDETENNKHDKIKTDDKSPLDISTDTVVVFKDSKADSITDTKEKEEAKSVLTSDINTMHEIEHTSDRNSNTDVHISETFKLNEYNLSDSKHTKADETGGIYEGKDLSDTAVSGLHVQGNCFQNVKDEDIHMSQTKEQCMSPPLFESQTEILVPENKAADGIHIPETKQETYSSPELTGKLKIGCRASPAGMAALPVDQEAEQPVGTILEKKYKFEVPKTDQLITMVIGEREGKLNIVCLCSSNLRFYYLQDDKWSCHHIEKLGFSIKRNSGCYITWVPHPSRLCIVLQQRRTDSVRLILYISCDSGMKSFSVDNLWSRSVLLCAAKESQFVASHVTSQKTYLTKYILNETDDVQRHNFDPVLDEITSLCVVRNITDALIGLSMIGQLYVWNYKQMSLLSTIDVSDVSLPDMICSHAFHEEGFLFLAVFSKRKCQQAGSVLVVNPQMGTSETLTALETKGNKWTGYAGSVIIQDEYISVRENSGSLLLWDIYSGELTSSLRNASITCVSSSIRTLAVGHKTCVHVYETVCSGIDREH